MQNRHIIIFDGLCNLCSSGVNFVIRRDPKSLFAFTPQQSELASQLMQKYGVEGSCTDTFILIKNGKCHFRSDAALEVAKELKGIWPVFVLLKIIPRPIRDICYNLIARNRYRLFGRRQVCEIPNSSIRDRFLG